MDAARHWLNGICAVGSRGPEARRGRFPYFDIARLVDFDRDYRHRGSGEQERLDPSTPWRYDFATRRGLFTRDPRLAPADNATPVLFALASWTPSPSVEAMRAAARAIAGPARLERVAGASHQLTQFEPGRC